MSFWDVVYDAVAAALRPAYAQIAAYIQTSLAPLVGNITGTIHSFLYPITATLSSIGAQLSNMGAQVIAGIQGHLIPIISGIAAIPGQINGLVGPYLANINLGLASFRASALTALSQVQFTLPTIPTITSAQFAAFALPHFAQITTQTTQIIQQLPDITAKVAAAVLAGMVPILAPFREQIQNFLQTVFKTGTDLLRGDMAGLKADQETLRAMFDTAMSGIGTEIGQMWQQLYAFFKDTVAPAVTAALHNFTTGIDAVYRAIGGSLLDGIASIASGDPADAVDRAMAVGLGVSAGLAAAYVGVEVIEFLYPTKNLSLIALVRDITSSFGINYFGPVMMGLLIAGALEPVMKQGLNEKYRHQLPATQQADQMWFHDALSDEALTKVYNRSGWSDEYQQAWRKSWFTEPNARTVITMLDVPGPWLEKVPEWLHHARYDDETATLIQQYGRAKTHQDDLKLLITQAKDDFVATLSDEGELRANLAAAELDSDEVNFQVAAAKSAARRSLLTDQVATTKENFMDGVVDQAGAKAALMSYGLSATKAEVLTNRWVAMKTPKLATATKTKYKNLTLAEIFDLYDRKRWTRAKVVTRLQDMDFTADDAEDLVWAHDQTVAGKTAAAA